MEERDARIAEALERATCHAGLLYERLVFAGRATGLVPPAASEADPLGALTVSDDDVSSMLASLRRVGAAPRGDARRAVPDPYDGLIAGSRAQLRAALERAEGCGLGLALAVRAFALDDAQLDALLVALAPDLDLRFGRVAGYLNNDTTRCRPTLGHLALAAQPGAAAGIDLRAQQALEAALLRPGLLERDDDGRTPAAGQAMRVPAHAVDLLATDVTTAAGEAVAWDALAWAPADRERLRTDLTRELARPRVERLVLVCGAPGAGRATIARAAATELGLPLVLVELEPASEAGDPRRRAALVGAVLRARLAGAALAIRWRPAPGETQLRVLHASARELDVPCLVLMGAGDLERIEPDVPFVRFDAPVVAASARRGLWARGLAAHGLGAAPRVLDDLATRYPLTPGRLGETVAELGARKAWIAGTAPVANAVADGCETVHDRPSERLDRLDVAITVEDVRETLGSITVGRLAHLARRHRAAIRLDDLAFPEAVSSRIAELIHRVELRRRVLSDWAFADKAHDGYGVSALFVGPPGTGKTAAAAAIANALHIDLYVVDLSRIMSKWVGETEQNLAQVFDEAEASSAALLFDEADALFGKRTVEQKGASDRYANLTINYLLQRMESFGGLAILTTNLMSAMDAAFQRRITSMVHFPPSDHDMRVQLWRKLLPAGARFGADVELDRLARDHVMEAAHIRRALVRAAFRAASRGQREAVLDARDLAWAAAAEYEDMGRIAHRERGDARPPVHRVNDHGGYR